MDGSTGSRYIAICMRVFSYAYLPAIAFFYFTMNLETFSSLRLM
jgi:hypothetical protein